MSYKLRSQQIIIDIPLSHSEPWINIKVQKVELDDDGNESRVIHRWGSVNRKLSATALEINKYFEVVPVTGNEISIYGLADAIKAAAVRWIVEEYGGSINANGDVIVEA